MEILSEKQSEQQLDKENDGRMTIFMVSVGVLIVTNVAALVLQNIYVSMVLCVITSSALGLMHLLYTVNKHAFSKMSLRAYVLQQDVENIRLWQIHNSIQEQFGKIGPTTTENLEEMLGIAIEEEDYEEAERLRKIIEARGNEE